MTIRSRLSSFLAWSMAEATTALPNADEPITGPPAEVVEVASGGVAVPSIEVEVAVGHTTVEEEEDDERCGNVGS